MPIFRWKFDLRGKTWARNRPRRCDGLNDWLETSGGKNCSRFLECGPFGGRKIFALESAKEKTRVNSVVVLAGLCCRVSIFPPHQLPSPLGSSWNRVPKIPEEKKPLKTIFDGRGRRTSRTTPPRKHSGSVAALESVPAVATYRAFLRRKRSELFCSVWTS